LDCLLAEAKAFNAALADFALKKTVVIGISSGEGAGYEGRGGRGVGCGVDVMAYNGSMAADEDHTAFVEKYGLKMTLLSDIGGLVRKKYEVRCEGHVVVSVDPHPSPTHSPHHRRPIDLRVVCGGSITPRPDPACVVRAHTCIPRGQVPKSLFGALDGRVTYVINKQVHRHRLALLPTTWISPIHGTPETPPAVPSLHLALVWCRACRAPLPSHEVTSCHIVTEQGVITKIHDSQFAPESHVEEALCVL
jgi:peroxiredoxin